MERVRLQIVYSFALGRLPRLPRSRSADRFVLIPGGYLAVAANAAVALGYIHGYGAMTYFGGLVWFLFVSAVQFVMLIVLHTDAT